MKFSDLFSFEKLISISLIKIVYWIGLLGGLIAGAVLFISALLFQGRVLTALSVLVGTVLGLLFWRVVCEAYIVIFGIYDRLGEIRDRTGSRPGV